MLTPETQLFPQHTLPGFEPPDTRTYHDNGIHLADRTVISYRFRGQLERLRVLGAGTAASEKVVLDILDDIGQFALDCYEDGFEDGLNHEEETN